MGYIYLNLAIVFEVIATILMKMSDGCSVIPATIGMIFSYVVCFFFASLALKVMDMGFFYAAWSAACIFILAIVGALFFHESLSLVKVLSTMLIIVGVIGFNYGSAHN